MAEIKLEKLTKVYADGTRAVDELDLEIEDAELVVLVGPSGCGKTSALRMVAGLEEITDGRVWLGDRVVNRVPPKGRDIAMIFQNYALYPHMSAYANMAFALRCRRCRSARSRHASGARPGCWGWSTYSRSDRELSPAASGSASRWAARSSANRRRS